MATGVCAANATVGSRDVIADSLCNSLAAAVLGGSPCCLLQEAVGTEGGFAIVSASPAPPRQTSF